MKLMKNTLVLFALIIAIFCTCSDDSGSSNNQPDYNMTGTYTFSNSGGNCTWTFTADGKYQTTCYGVVGTLTGTWSASGNDVTISYGVGSVSGKEVFTVRENGNQLTLTLKDDKAPVSNVLSSFKVVAKSVILTKTSSSGNNGGGNTAVTFSDVTANGSASQTTTELTLTFSQAITGLSANDITLSGVPGVTKGTLSGSGPAYTLSISGFTEGGDLSVAVAKSGDAISGSPKTVTIYYYYSGVSPGTIEMVSIPAGTFIMGSPESEPNRSNDETQHSVTLSGFSMGKYQVTQAQWIAVMGSSEDRTTNEYGKGNNHPVYMVNWYDTVEFCNKLSIIEGLNPVYSLSGETNPAEWGAKAGWDFITMDRSKNGYRLPTEAEWEYACRGSYTNKASEVNTKPFGIGDGTKMVSGMANFNVIYPYDLNHSPAGDYTDTSATGYVGKVTEVGSYTENNYGLYDMHGNVNEWCWDWYGDYSGSPVNDPTGAVIGSTESRVLRGASWGGLGLTLRSANRDKLTTYIRYNNNGFRLVRSGS